MPLDLPPKVERWTPPKPAIIRAWKQDIKKAVLPGILPVAPVFAPPVASAFFESSYSSTTDTSAFTNAAADIGTPAGNRYLVIVASYCAANNRTLSSLTVDGNAVTVHHDQGGQLDAGAQRCRVVIAGIAWPTGSTADIVLTWNGAVISTAMAIYALYDLISTTPTATNGAGTTSGTNSSISTTLDIPANGIYIVMACIRSQSGSTDSFTLTGASEDYDIQTAEVHRYHGGHLASAPAETARSFVSTSSVNNAFARAIAVAAWH